MNTGGSFFPLNHQTRSKKDRRSAIALALAAILLSLSLATIALTGLASARPYHQTALLSSGNAPSQPVTSTTVPAGVGTSLPNPVTTAGVPGAVETRGSANSATSGSAGGVAGTTATPPANSFPWLPLTILAIVVLLGIALAIMWTRRSRLQTEPMVVAGSATRTRPSGTVRPYTGGETYTEQTTVSTTVPAMAPPEAEAVSAIGAPVTPPSTVAATAATAAAATAPAPAPATVVCPNCGTENSINENFCHECGQDLRPERAKLMAAAPPINIDELPYLETLDRTDEQLEFVLSRPRVVIGSAAGNDIVIDSAYKGWQTVSPQHAELRKEQDGFVVVDRDSENGTFVNEVRTGENILTEGDTLRLGDVRFIFHVP
jgi:hypothetical protein